jgi:type II secretory pathway component PulJ
MLENLALIWGALLSLAIVVLIRKVNKMSAELDALIANEANLETVVAQVAADNAAIHAELTAALAAADVGAIQAVADKIAAQTAKLSALVTPPAPPAA